jgi:hypothetical protein
LFTGARLPVPLVELGTHGRAVRVDPRGRSFLRGDPGLLAFYFAHGRSCDRLLARSPRPSRAASQMGGLEREGDTP